jgi:hypothetical protein
MPICPADGGIMLTPRHCGVLKVRLIPGFRMPCIWAFLNSLLMIFQRLTGHINSRAKSILDK